MVRSSNITSFVSIEIITSQAVYHRNSGKPSNPMLLFVEKKNRLTTYIVKRLLAGRSDGTRTHDLLVPNQAHYQTVPHPGKPFYYIQIAGVCQGRGQDFSLILYFMRSFASRGARRTFFRKRGKIRWQSQNRIYRLPRKGGSRFQPLFRRFQAFFPLRSA